MDTSMDLNITKFKKVSEYVQAYDFEVYDILETINLLVKFRPLLFASIGLYIFLVYYGQMWMKNRPAYKLKTELFLWNLALSVFSIAATVRAGPELVYLLRKPDGFYHAICDSSTHNYATSFWGLMILFSKFAEFGDTAFIVLRKQKLIVLHWYHHAATVLVCWFGYEYYVAAGRFIVMNTFVHSFMYAYYAMKAAGVKIPRRVSMALTTLQILQLTIGVYGAYVSVLVMMEGRPCRKHRNILYLGSAVIFSFLVLFINFYLKTYFGGQKKKSE